MTPDDAFRARVSDAQIEEYLKTEMDQYHEDGYFTTADALRDLRELRRAAHAALERLGGDARDGNFGWHRDHPILDALRACLGDTRRTSDETTENV